MVNHIQPLDLLRALSSALELSSGGLSQHQWRTALIADRIAIQLFLKPQERQVLAWSALLHDLGAAARWEEKRDIAKWDEDINIYKHAEQGWEMLRDSPQLKEIARPIRHHHDHFDGSSPPGLAGNNIPLISRIIYVADRMEILIQSNQNIFLQREHLLTSIRKRSGSYFDPDVVAALVDLAHDDSFWLDLVTPEYFEIFFHNLYGDSRVLFTLEDIMDIGKIFANIVDRTSRFTARHSRSVADVAGVLAEIKGYGDREIQLIKLAGLFHDLGKLAVPNEYLEKPGKLTAAEFSFIKQHPYYTYRILQQIQGFSIIAECAGYHHMTLDGGGYPFRIKGKDLRLGSRIIAVADVFAALTEPRPYRNNLSTKEVEKIMRGMVTERKIDPEITADLFTCHNRVSALVQQDGKDLAG